MKLTNPEKLILLMLSEIYDKLGLDNTDTELLRQAIYTENTWALDWQMTGVVGSDAEETPDLVSEVANYLGMWEVLENSFASFDGIDKERIKREAEPFGENVRFRGFDGNNESELMSIASMFINHMDRFQHFENRALNSHMPSRATYARMHDVYEGKVVDMHDGTLSADAFIDVVKAMKL